MPSSEQILTQLGAIANQWRLVAIIWHVYFAALVIALLMGMRPSQRIVAVLLALPLFSVSVLAWLAANPFNGTVFAVLGIALVAIALRLPDEAIQVAPLWLAGVGVILFVFGWVYPHFLATDSFLPYLYAAPMGLIPCPTLSIIIGSSLILGGFDSRGWSIVLGAAGVVYGLIGVLQLGVAIDAVLLVGALVLLAAPFVPHQHEQTQALAH